MQGLMNSNDLLEHNDNTYPRRVTSADILISMQHIVIAHDAFRLTLS